MNLTKSVKSLLIPISGLLFVFFILLGLIFIFVPDNIDNFLSMQNLKTILKQIQQIENLVNEFSDFARMPKPLIKNNDLIKSLKITLIG